MTDLDHRSRATSNPWLIYSLWIALCVAVFWHPLRALIHHSLNNDDASHVILIPLIVGWLLYTERKKISTRCVLDIKTGSYFFAAAVVLAGASSRTSWHGSDVSFAFAILALTALLVAGFVAVFGRVSAKKVYFALALLLLIVPLPEVFLNRVTYSLQYGSAAVAGWIFDLSGIPVLREGFVFRLPDLSIEVAQECSGIRSSIALLILALLVAHFSFGRLWKKTLFVVAGLGIMIVKNGVRIATLTILAEYVNPDFLYGKLHHRGGVVFFLIGLALLVPIYWFLKRGETDRPQTDNSAAAA